MTVAKRFFQENIVSLKQNKFGTFLKNLRNEMIRYSNWAEIYKLEVTRLAPSTGKVNKHNFNYISFIVKSKDLELITAMQEYILPIDIVTTTNDVYWISLNPTPQITSFMFYPGSKRYKKNAIHYAIDRNSIDYVDYFTKKAENLLSIQDLINLEQYAIATNRLEIAQLIGTKIPAQARVHSPITIGNFPATPLITSDNSLPEFASSAQTSISDLADFAHFKPIVTPITASTASTAAAAEPIIIDSTDDEATDNAPPVLGQKRSSSDLNNSFPTVAKVVKTDSILAASTHSTTSTEDKENRPSFKPQLTKYQKQKQRKLKKELQEVAKKYKPLERFLGTSNPGNMMR